MRKIILLVIVFALCLFGSAEAVKVIDKEITYHGNTLSVKLPTEISAISIERDPDQKHRAGTLIILRFKKGEDYIDLILAQPRYETKVLYIRALIADEPTYYTHFEGTSAYTGGKRMFVEVRRISQEEFYKLIKFFCKDTSQLDL